MKKIYCAVGLFCLVSCATFSQKVVHPTTKDSVELNNLSPHKVTQIIKTNPFPILFGHIPLTSEYRIGIEVVTSSHQSAQASFSYIGKWVFLSSVENQQPMNNNNIIITTSGARIQLQHKFYMLGDLGGFLEKNEYAPEGFYISPHVSFATARFSTKAYNQYDIYLRVTHFNVNLLAGYQTIALGAFAIDFFAGLGYKKNTWLEHNSANNIQIVDPDELPLIYTAPIKLTLGFNVGYGF